MALVIVGEKAELALRLYQAKTPDRGIAAALRVTPQTVKNWRKREGLPAHFQHGYNGKGAGGPALLRTPPLVRLGGRRATLPIATRSMCGWRRRDHGRRITGARRLYTVPVL